MFGLVLMRKSRYQAELNKKASTSYHEGISYVVDTIKRALESPQGKVITQQQTLIGDGQEIRDCVFLHCEPYSLRINPEKEN